MIINIIIIYSKYLTNRLNYINSSLSFLKTIIEKNNYICNIILSNDPDDSFILDNLSEYNKRVNYDKDDNNEYNKLIVPLNSNQISNIEKHRKALLNVKDNQLNFIIEDDLLISKDYINNIEILFNNILKNNYFDILITSDFITNDNINVELINYINYDKVLLSKSSYFINKKTADKLYNYLETFKYDMRISLSKFITNNISDLKVYLLNKCTFLEGSKVGIFLSSIKNKNFLSQNGNFIELVKITNNEIINDVMFNSAKNLYEQLEYLDNADVIHTYAILHYKMNDIKKAKELMTKAALNIHYNHGYYSKNNDILNNAINIYQYDQYLLDECINIKSKYDI